MSQVNLLPPEIRQRVRTRQLAILIGAAGAIVVVLMLLFAAGKSVQLSQINNQIAVQNSVNAGLTQQAQELQVYADANTQLTNSQKLVDTALSGEISWSTQLHNVQLIIPNGVALTGFDGTATASATGVAPVVTTPGAVATAGSISFDGDSEGTLRIARWLTRCVEIRGWANAWLSNASETPPGSNIYSFNSTVDLLTTAETARGQQGASTG